MTPEPGNDDAVIDTSDLVKRYGSKAAIKRLNLRVRRGSIHGFLGPNGSGKTTTIRMLSGLLRPTSGSIRVLGEAMPERAETLRNRIGYMTQRFSLYEDLSARENLRFVADIHALPRNLIAQRIDTLVVSFGLEQCRATRAAHLSGGERQRLALAAATLHEPELLFLDEPTSAVDPKSRREFWDLLFRLSQRGTTIIVNTHYMEEAQRCHSLGILDDGQLVACDSPDRLVAHVGARVVGVQTTRLDDCRNVLERAADVVCVTQVGVRLRVLVEAGEPDPVGFVEGCLDEFDGDRSVTQLPPSLEDAFVIFTTRRRRADA